MGPRRVSAAGTAHPGAAILRANIPNSAAPTWNTPPEEVLALRGGCTPPAGADRPPPGRQVLTAWNGLMLAALARAGLLDEDKYLKAAADCADFQAGLHGRRRPPAGRWREGRRHSQQAGLLRLLRLGPLGIRHHTMEYLGEPRGWPGFLGAFDRENGGLPLSSDGEQLLTGKRSSYGAPLWPSVATRWCPRAGPATGSSAARGRPSARWPGRRRDCTEGQLPY